MLHYSPYIHLVLYTYKICQNSFVFALKTIFCYPGIFCFAVTCISANYQNIVASHHVLSADPDQFLQKSQYRLRKEASKA